MLSTTSELTEITSIKTNYIYKTLKGFMAIGIPSILVSLTTMYALGWNSMYIIHLFGALFPFLLFYLRNKLNYKTIAAFLIADIFLMGVSSFFYLSFFSTAMISFFICMLICTIFFSKRTATLFLLFSIAFLLFILFLHSNQYLVYYLDFNAYNNLKSVWFNQISGFILFSILFIILMSTFHETLYSQIFKEKKQSEDLKRAFDKAEESDRLKMVFLQNMSHEIRTPMNAIVGFSNILQNESTLTDEKRLEYLKIISQRTNDLLSIINDILDISKMEAGEIILEETDKQIPEILEEIESFFNNRNSQIIRKPITIVTECNFDNANDFYVADFSRLRQVLINLIDNAYKFTENGLITLKCTKTDSMFQFDVIDTGIGIPPEKTEIIFDRFRQADETINNRKYGGTGLGLSIAKKIVESMNGNIWVTSIVGKGSTFSFTIPCKKSDRPNTSEQIKSKESTTKTKTILIVEDDEYNMEYTLELIKNQKFNLLTAETGKTAIEIFERNRHIDAILMDIRLPDTNGFHLTKTFKMLNPKIKIIAQTAYATKEDEALCYKNGCDAYISKPFSKQTLLDTIHELLN